MFGEKLKEARKKRNLTLHQLADLYNLNYDAGMSKGTLSKYENNKQEPMISVVKKLADLLNVSVDFLLENNSYEDLSFTQVDFDAADIKIPVLGRVVAGIPVEAIQEVIGYVEIPQDLDKTGYHFGLQIKGDSMLPEFKEGDTVIVRKQENIENGEIAVVIVDGADATVKKVKLNEKGISLIPINHSYDTMFYTTEEVKTLPVTIIGKVVRLHREY